MYVCVCHAITDREVRAAVTEGAAQAEEVFHHFGVQVRCGRCVATMRSMMSLAGNGAAERRHVTDGQAGAPAARCRGCTR